MVHLFGMSQTEAVHTEVGFILAVIAESIDPAGLCSCYFTSLVCSNHAVAFTASLPFTPFATLKQSVL